MIKYENRHFDERRVSIIKYIDSLTLPTEREETGYLLSFPFKLEACYSQEAYPFKLFPQKGLRKLEFGQITLLYGGNGSGKSTILNIIAQKLCLNRVSPFNNTPVIDDYIKYCKCDMRLGRAPSGSRIITSDDVFDFLLDIRSINEGISDRREKLFEQYEEYTDSSKASFRLKSLDDYDELKRRNEARFGTKASFASRRLPKELCGKSNGESAFVYFTQKIESGALYLLDEPENSLSPKLQSELVSFISDSARFYNCQFIISTHSPFLLSMKDALIYDLDSKPVEAKRWTELEGVRLYYDLFSSHGKEFDCGVDK